MYLIERKFMSSKIRTVPIEEDVPQNLLTFYSNDPAIRLNITELRNRWRLPERILCTLVDYSAEVNLGGIKYSNHIMAPNASHLLADHLIESGSIVAPKTRHSQTPKLVTALDILMPCVYEADFSKLLSGRDLIVNNLDVNIFTKLEVSGRMEFHENDEVCLPQIRVMTGLHSESVQWLQAPQLKELHYMIAPQLTMFDAPLEKAGFIFVPKYDAKQSPSRPNIKQMYETLEVSVPTAPPPLPLWAKKKHPAPKPS